MFAKFVSAVALFVCFAISSADVLAEGGDWKVSVAVPLYTEHFNDVNENGGSWNEGLRNHGLFLELGHTSSDWSILAGSYDNSYHKTSVLLGAAYRPLKFWRFEAGLMAGVVSGYDVPAMAAGSVKINISENVGIHAIVVPTFKERSGFVATQLVLGF